MSSGALSAEERAQIFRPLYDHVHAFSPVGKSLREAVEALLTARLAAQAEAHPREVRQRSDTAFLVGCNDGRAAAAEDIAKRIEANCNHLGRSLKARCVACESAASIARAALRGGSE